MELLVETDREQACTSMRALLILAAQRGVQMTRTKTVKLLYLADVRSAADDGQTRTGVLWRWRRYGPYCRSLRGIEDQLVRDGAIERESQRLGPDGAEAVLTASPRDAEAVRRASELAPFLDAVLAAHGHKSERELTWLAYDSPPMRAAQEHDEHGFVLVFDDRPDPDRDLALGRFKRHSDSEAFLASIEARL